MLLGWKRCWSAGLEYTAKSGRGRGHEGDVVLDQVVAR